jgi:hypothetical protein
MKRTAMTTLPALTLFALLSCGGGRGDGVTETPKSSSRLGARVVDADGVPQPGPLTDSAIDPFLRAHVTIEGSSGSSDPTSSSLRPYFKEWIRLLGGDDFLYNVLQRASNYHLTVTSSYSGVAATGGGQTSYNAAFWDNYPDRRVPTLIHETMHIMDSGASSDGYYQAMMADPSKQWDSYAMTSRAEYVACATEWILTNGQHDANETNRQRLRRMDPDYYAYLCNTLIWNVLYTSQGAGPTAGPLVFDSGDRNAATPAEWDSGNYKGDCGSCSVPTGLSQRADLSAAHAILCAPNCTFTGNGVTTLTDIANGDHRRASRLGDWDTGYYKSECGLNEYVSGVSMDPSSKKLHGLRCASASLANGGANNCETRLAIQDDRGDTAYGDWDYGFYKSQCSAGKVIYGVSTVPSTGRPHRILCCSF